ncbi:hypothetical protein [Mycolicibacter arupensis]|jgi:hypothetical protein|uniref:Uncharacterized protein n=1 Tax=Mycolicibacter arupensis TaxID=342002 RepID=A0A5C7Y8Q3_9MYCO|nr:hypothetical protein [Mycolicibacter arupensis]TXI57972.1 MAG: hypothetical protein E6Q54_06755 [Mycolicibacter arupensis]
MPTSIPADFTKDDVVNPAQWLIAENGYYADYLGSAMYQKQMELTAELHQVRERNEHLTTENTQLRERLGRLTVAFVTLIGDAMRLANLDKHPSTPSRAPDQRCTEAANARARRARSLVR